MVKVTINGEVFEWDPSPRPMSEALALEKELGMRYADWETELEAGSARAMAAQVWLIWRRNGRDIPLADILSGKVDFDLRELTFTEDSEPEPPAPLEGQPVNPTPASQDQAGTPTT